MLIGWCPATRFPTFPVLTVLGIGILCRCHTDLRCIHRYQRVPVSTNHLQQHDRAQLFIPRCVNLHERTAALSVTGTNYTSRLKTHHNSSREEKKFITKLFQNKRDVPPTWDVVLPKGIWLCWPTLFGFSAANNSRRHPTTESTSELLDWTFWQLQRYLLSFHYYSCSSRLGNASRQQRWQLQWRTWRYSYCDIGRCTPPCQYHRLPCIFWRRARHVLSYRCVPYLIHSSMSTPSTSSSMCDYYNVRLRLHFIVFFCERNCVVDIHLLRMST